ncbi:MAG TPA: alpha/beta fold hydrolase [Actinomycetes bacterium]|nr:alpha/beta fold hydrolase [Actinomycetes bacterium]
MGHPAAAGATLPDGGAESRFLTATDDVRLHLLQWSGERPSPWAVVVYLHGIASHAGWFSETAAHLRDQGVTVYAPDRRGSGRSGGPRGHLDRYRRALDDAGQAVRLAAAEHEGTPVFLAASSWAAKLAVVHAAWRPASLSGLLLLGPGLLARVDLPPVRLLQVVAGHLVRPTARVRSRSRRSCTPPTRATWTSSAPTRCGSSTPRPGSSGRPRGWTACAGAPAPA